MNTARREWVRITRRETGHASVTVTASEAEAVVKWTEKTYSTEIEKSTVLAREKAHRALDAALAVVRDSEVPK